MAGLVMLPNGLQVQISARRVGSGLQVFVSATPSDLTKRFDEQYHAAVASHLASDQATRMRHPYPLTGAEALMDELALHRSDGGMPPHSLIRMAGGDTLMWSVVWSSPDWQPEGVILSGTATPGLRIKVD